MTNDRIHFVAQKQIDDARVQTDRGTSTSDWVIGDLDNIALAVRIRRWWLGDIVPWLLEVDHDLSYGWKETTLVRRGLILDVVSSIDFGLGDPFGNGVREELSSRLVTATTGHLNQLSWKFRGNRPKPFRRAASTNCDVFNAGDPTAGCEEVAVQLSKRVPKSLAADARVAIQALSVAAVSKHRVWLVAPDKKSFSAIGTASGARFAVHDAVRRFQKNDPLYSIYVDPAVACDSPRLT